MIVYTQSTSGIRPEGASAAALAAHSAWLASKGIDPATPAKRRASRSPKASLASLSPCAVTVGRAPDTAPTSDTVPTHLMRDRNGRLVMPKDLCDSSHKRFPGRTPQHVHDAFDRAVMAGRYRPATIEDAWGPARRTLYRDTRTGQAWVAV